VEYPARERWRRLPRDADREEYFRVLREAVAEFYLADPGNPYQQSGRSSGADRWEKTRRIFVQAIHRSGDFIDIGCANGLLLESLTAWARQEGFAIRPHGIDLIPELVELARQRLPDHRKSFEVANAWDWSPKRQYDFVRTNVEYVPQQDWIVFVRRQYAAVAPGGRLILAHYRNVDEAHVDVGNLLVEAGHVVTGRAETPGVSIAWTEVRSVAASQKSVTVALSKQRRDDAMIR
jgi:2-polyprenyl-3-methyl-5-hydroxy-6-metoxy-1,4-benzoquinol methylase